METVSVPILSKLLPNKYPFDANLTNLTEELKLSLVESAKVLAWF